AGYAKKRGEFLKPGKDCPELEYDRIKSLAGLTAKPITENRFRDDIKLLSENKLYSFEIPFARTQKTFDAEKYGDDFRRALRQASLFGNAAVVLRGHADGGAVVDKFLTAGMNQGFVEERPDGQYALKGGQRLDLSDTKSLVTLINQRTWTEP